MTHEEYIRKIRYASFVSYLIERIYDKLPYQWVYLNSMQNLLDFLENETKI